MNESKNSERVLNFGVPWSSAQTQYVLWPVLGYRLIAPMSQPKRRINLIEMAVLGLIRAGKTEKQQIADLLGLSAELVKYITRKLKDDVPPAIDDQMRITNAGMDLIADAEVSTTQQRTGWIFQDPWSGEVWWRFVEDLPTVQVLRGGSDFREIDIGTEGAPFIAKPILIEPRQSFAMQPTPAEILRSVRYEKHKAVEDPEDDDGHSRQINFSKETLAKVSYLDPVPELMYCLTAILVDKELGSTGNWSVRDLFKPSVESMRLHRSIRLKFNEYPKLPQRLAEMLGIAQNTKSQDYQDVLCRIQDTAEMVIKARFGPLADEFGALQSLCRLEVCRQKLQIEGEYADPEPVFIQSGRLIERVMKRVRTQFPAKGHVDYRAFKRGDKCTEFVGMNTVQRLKAMGYREVPKSLLVLNHEHLKSVMLYDDIPKGSAMRLVLAAVITADFYEHHPMKDLAPNMPHMLEQIDAIMERRNPSSHDTEEIQPLSEQVQLAMRLAEHAFDIAKKVFRSMHDLKNI